jgi:hypothetical protein
MNGRTRRALICALGFACLAATGCGGQGATASEQRQVRGFVPAAREIHCARHGASTQCEALVGNALVGTTTWHCEFTFVRDTASTAYSGTKSCWFP